MPKFFAPKPPPPPPAPEPKVEPITADVVKAQVNEALGGVVNDLRGTIASLTERVTELATRQPQVIVQPGQPAPAQREHPGISDAELDQAVLSGHGAAERIRALVDRQINAGLERVVREHVDPLRTFGTETLANLSHEVSLKQMPYYNKFKKEIDQGVAGLDPQLRANPAVLKMVHDAVVGSHANDLVSEAGEQAIRQAQEEATRGTVTPGTGSGREPKREQAEVPTAEAIGGRDALDALSHKGPTGQGQDQDAFARSLGYSDWKSYMKQYDDLIAAETKGNA